MRCQDLPCFSDDHYKARQYLLVLFQSLSMPRLDLQKALPPLPLHISTSPSSQANKLESLNETLGSAIEERQSEKKCSAASHFYPRFHSIITRPGLRSRRLIGPTSLDILMPPLFSPFSSNAGLRNRTSFLRLSIRLDDLVTYHIFSSSSDHSNFRPSSTHDTPRNMEMAEHLDRKADADMRELLECYRPGLRYWALNIPSTPNRIEDILLPADVQQGFRVFSLEPRRTRWDRFHNRTSMPEDMRLSFSVRSDPLIYQSRPLSFSESVRSIFQSQPLHLSDTLRTVSLEVSATPLHYSSQLEQTRSVTSNRLNESATQPPSPSSNHIDRPDIFLSGAQSLYGATKAIHKSGRERPNLPTSLGPISRRPAKSLRSGSNWLKRHSSSVLSAKRSQQSSDLTVRAYSERPRADRLRHTVVTSSPTFAAWEAHIRQQQANSAASSTYSQEVEDPEITVKGQGFGGGAERLGRVGSMLRRVRGSVHALRRRLQI